MIPHYSFPRTRFVDESGITVQLFHMASEFWEIIKALAARDLQHAVHEAFDLIGSTETLIRKIVRRAGLKECVINPMVIKIDVIEKNRIRGYYGRNDVGYMTEMVQLSEGLKTARADAMAQFGSQYNDQIEPVKELIVRDMAATGMTPLDSTFRLAKKVQDAGNDPLVYLAAGVELVMVGGAA